MKSFLITLCLAFVSAVLFAGFVFSYMFFSVSPKSGIVEIRIEPGESFSTVVRKLRDQKVVTNERLFSLWARYSGLEKKIHWGLYRFELPLSLLDVRRRLQGGDGGPAGVEVLLCLSRQVAVQHLPRRQFLFGWETLLCPKGARSQTGQNTGSANDEVTHCILHFAISRS